MAMVQAARALRITLIIERGAAAGAAHAEFAALHRASAGIEEGFRQRASICAIGSRRYHGAGGNEPRRARARESRSDRHRARARAISSSNCSSRAFRVSMIGRVYRSLASSHASIAAADFVELPREKMVRAFDDHQPLRLGERRKERFDTWRASRTDRSRPG